MKKITKAEAQWRKQLTPEQYQVMRRNLTSINPCIYNSYMKTVLNVKTDKEVKEEAKKVAEELGVPLSVIVNAYLKQFVRNKEVYLSTAPYMLPELEQLLGLVEDDIQHRRNLSPTLSTQKALDEYLSRL